MLVSARILTAAAIAGALAICALTLPPTSVRAATAFIVIDKLAYGPAPHGLRVGDTVQWENRDIFKHSVTARDGSFDLALAPGAKAKLMLKRAGAILYYCRYHPRMKGEIDVTR